MEKAIINEFTFQNPTKSATKREWDVVGEEDTTINSIMS